MCHHTAWAVGLQQSVLRFLFGAYLGVGDNHRAFNQLWKQELFYSSRCGVNPLKVAQVWPDVLQQKYCSVYKYGRYLNMVGTVIYGW